MESEINKLTAYTIKEGPLKVEHLKVIHGANYFSGGPVVLIRLDLGAYDEVFSDQIEDFYESLIGLLPSLYEHFCSIGEPGGFLQRVKEGTLMGHIIEHVAIDLQTLAGMDVGFGKTRSTAKQGVYNIIFRFFDEEAGIYAGKAAVNLVNAILLKEEFDVFKTIEALILIRELRLLGPSTQAIVDAAENRKIPWYRLDKYNLVQLGTGKYQKKIRATITSETNLLAVEAADNKYLTIKMLEDAGIPVLKTIKTESVAAVLEFHKKLGQPIVIKPNEGYLGKNSAINLNSASEINNGFNHAMAYDKTVIAQPFIKGRIFRLLVIDFRFVAAVELIPPMITGNGKNTITELIDLLNGDPERQYGDKGKLSKVVVDEVTTSIISQQGYELNSILPDEESILLKWSPNPRLGGTSIDMTELIDPYNIFIAERAAKVLGLNVAGIDIIAPTIDKPINVSNGIVLEVNAAPDFRMHIKPVSGRSRNVANSLVNMLFPAKQKSHVPLFSVTGSEGTTEFVKFLKQCLDNLGYYTGTASSEGIVIGDKLIVNEDSTMPQHARMVLIDPSIDAAIVETSFKGIMEDGLGYDKADFGIFLNLTDTYKDSTDLKYLEDISYAKSVVVEQVSDEGFAVLNADNQTILDNHNRLYSNVILFSGISNNLEIEKHFKNKGLVVYRENLDIILGIDGQKRKVLEITDLKLDDNTKVKQEIFLALIAVLSSFGISDLEIKKLVMKTIPKQD